MSYSYSNPYAAPQSSSRATITTTPSTQHCQILFGGLPPDATEHDLRPADYVKDLLISPMLALSEHSVSVRGLYSSEGKFLGMALVQVSNGADAEKVRSHCSGQIIDATYRLTVQHVLPPTQPLPPQTVQPFIPTTTAAPKQTPAQPKAQAQTPKGPKTASGSTPKASNKPPGLQLLQRMGKAGPPGAREKQAALLAQQKANLKLSASQPGKALLNRLNKSSAGGGKSTPPNSKGKAKASPATDKVSRAKAKANSNKMELDEPITASTAKKTGGRERSVPKTQAQLDDEMRQYERERRFAQA